MYLIKSVAIEGFWGTYDFDVPLDPEVTFFIGQNGTGKTTFINLLAAALTADFRTLDRMPFKKISISLLPKQKDDKPSITVTRSVKKGSPFELIDYHIVPGGGNQKEVRFSLDDTEEQMMLRRLHRDPHYFEYYHRFKTGLLPVLQDLVKVNWLSIHRMSPQDRPRDDRTFESSIDQKIEALSNDLVRYFATLSKQKDDKIRVFQEYIFVSLIEHRSDIDPFDASRLELVPQYSEALQNIFKELHVQGETGRLLAGFAERAVENKAKLAKDPRSGLDFDEIIFRIGLYRIEEVVRKWENLQAQLKEIFKQRDRFQSIADDLFQRKRMSFSESNEMIFTSRSGTSLTPQMLSSGEKQLLILMSEALLQREMPAIFIADEPELSLHVLWQERLVSSLRALNPNAQIVSATHSPDIVGPLIDKAIDMESLVK
ncbi:MULTISPECIES: AAA family ATPase [unclassified Novosphingobium]|uniref:AAA family ATPase n=1 Tax=unclassified Novosphingobium TaxID=2644732 RepID=UPI000D31D9CE|nr:MULTISPECIES: AAA family ATPase [unclassified Novosphingobium]PTR07587.1 AAA ATPase-like protein [Novosphingobium sp. GV055]PUB00289.1 AAA ATPase-like protein [Novosphingobium sp. GV061]PUB15330.1 AAA ATPase-like protein [Novosphingobium sp. GV079]PUB39206.1 AAA ATPase-like protein [Novosphingobium sp. GV027]